MPDPGVTTKDVTTLVYVLEENKLFDTHQFIECMHVRTKDEETAYGR